MLKKVKQRHKNSFKMVYIIKQVLHCSLNFYPLMNHTGIYLSLAKLLEIAEFPKGDELKRSKETLETT